MIQNLSTLYITEFASSARRVGRDLLVILSVDVRIKSNWNLIV